MNGIFLDRINMINRIGEGGNLTGKHEGMKDMNKD
jgi:hypothetical protein